MPEPIKRPSTMNGFTHKVMLGCGNAYITINYLDEKPLEVFCQIGNSGTCTACMLEAIGRLCSLALRSGIDAKEVSKQLKHIRCDKPMFGEDGMVQSCSDAIARLLCPPEKKNHGEEK